MTFLRNKVRDLRYTKLRNLEQDVGIGGICLEWKTVATMMLSHALIRVGFDTKRTKRKKCHRYWFRINKNKQKQKH